MRVKNKRTIILLLLVGCVLLGYWFWLSVRPIDIVDVHTDGEFSDVLVRNFPVTARGKINWWLKNKEILEKTYHIPHAGKDVSFSVTFWLFGDGYKEEGKHDRRCFEDMNTPVNCIDKNKVFSVDKSRNMGISFTANNGYYRIKENSDIIKIEQR